eukprot:11325494-Ditylum_brightwellii.AAC.1
MFINKFHRMVKFCRLARLQQDLGDVTCTMYGIKSKLPNGSSEHIGGERSQCILPPNEATISI